MNEQNAYDILSAASAAGLIQINADALLRACLGDSRFLQIFDQAGEGDAALRAVALLVTLDREDEDEPENEYPDYTVHTLTEIECYESRSGNKTWKGYDEDQQVIYLRQSHEDMLKEAGLWDGLDAMQIGDEADCDICVHTVEDGDFRKPVMIEGSAEVRIHDKTDDKTDDKKSDEPYQRMLALTRDEYVILDTETTGLYGFPIQIAVLSSEGDVLFDRRIKPPYGYKVEPEATAIHGITNDMLADAPEFDAVINDLNEVIAGRVLVAWNAEFDRKVMARACDKYDVVMRSQRWRCAMRAYNPDKWTKLVEAAAAEGVPVADAHDAAGDCKMTLGVIKSVDIPF